MLVQTVRNASFRLGQIVARKNRIGDSATYNLNPGSIPESGTTSHAR
jgi:hypothetical protein